MLLTPSEISREQPLDSWFCLRAQPKREHIAAACLHQISEVEVFCPRVRFRKHTNRGPVWFVEAMFPGYLFARFDYGAFHRRIRQSPAISGFVQFGDRLALLPDELVSEMKIRTGGDELVEVNQMLEPGQNVQIAQGPFQGLEALVTRLITARERVEILIEWMGRSLHAEASVADLVPLSHSGSRANGVKCNGVMECWSREAVNRKRFPRSEGRFTALSAEPSSPLLHYSITPALHHSNAP